MGLRTLGIFLAATLAIAGALAAPARAQNLLQGLPLDGIRCDTTEGAVQHVHTHLQLFNHGRAITVPGQIGIPQGAGCLYWVHTHSDDGIIHIESPVKRTFTLGEFFDIWDMDLSRTRAGTLHASPGHKLRVSVNGKIWTQDPRRIPLRDHEEIVIQSGPPYAKGHPADWSQM